MYDSLTQETISEETNSLQVALNVSGIWNTDFGILTDQILDP